MPYTKQSWVDGPGGGTPVSAARLSHIEDGIEAAAIISPEEADNLAASVSFSGRYHQTRLFIPAGSCENSLGTRTVATWAGQRGAGLVMVDGTNTTISFGWVVPNGWETVQIYAVFVNQSTGTGVVQIPTIDSVLTDNSTAAVTANTPSVDVTVYGQDIFMSTPVGSPFAVTQQGFRNLRIGRAGGAAADTLTNAIVYIGTLLIEPTLDAIVVPPTP